MEQATDSILMIRPANFGFNPETAESNSFQEKQVGLRPNQIRELSVSEFDRFVEQMRSKDVNVIVVDDDPQLENTDAVFPNNWISFHADGQINIYPMFSVMRRNERKNKVLEIIEEKFQVKNLSDYSHYEKNEKYLEGTGSMVIDRAHCRVYSCFSNRTDPSLLARITSDLNYTLIAFTATDAEKIPIYHTNVMMSIGSSFAVICQESIADQKERENVINSLESTGHKVIDIRREQMVNFAGNILEVRSRTGQSIIVMSESALNSLDEWQLKLLSSFGQLLPVSIPTIETAGGGSVRCMMAEIFLPARI